MAEQSLESILETHLAQRGGTVVERLVTTLQKLYKEDAPELQSEDSLKAFVAERSNKFKVVTSVNNVERIRLTNPPKRERRKASPGLVGLAVSTMKGEDAVSEEHAMTLTDLYNKVVAIRQAENTDAELPYDLVDESEFARSIRTSRGRRVVLRQGQVWLDAPRPRGPRSSPPRSRRAPSANNGDTTRALPPPRAGRPRPPPGTPRTLNMPANPNDTTLIASIVYSTLKTRGAVTMDYGSLVKVLLRIVSATFIEQRPDVTASSMNSLRIFKLMLSEVPGVACQRPLRTREPTNGRPRRRLPMLEPVVWIEDEDAFVNAINTGLPDELAHAEVKPDVIDDVDGAQSGKPVHQVVLEQPTWTTQVIGPTSDEAVLKNFLESQKSSQIWGFETEHRVGLGRKPAGNISIISISSMDHTLIWDVQVGGIPACLHDFISNEEIFKGCLKVAPKALKLKQQFGCEPKQFVELAKIAKELGTIEDASRAGMYAISQAVLNVGVSRSTSVRDSNWELRPMSKRQYLYAVEDGYVSALLFVHMTARLHKEGQGHKLTEACITLE